MNKDCEIVSVIVPVYNVEQYISKCIESIQLQTYKELEIILVNDGSSDQSGKICDDYAKADERIRVINIENGGVSNARNCGLNTASGKYIAFVDGDDTIKSDYIEYLYKTLKTYDVDCVNCATEYIYESKTVNKAESLNIGNVKILTNREAVDAVCYLQQVFASYDMAAIWGCLYKKDLIGDTRFDTNIKIGEDFLFKFSVFQKVDKIACISNQGYNYLIRSDSAMRTGYDVQKVESIRVLSRNVDNVANTYKVGYISRIVNIAIVVLFMIPIEKKYDVERKYITGIIKQYRKDVLKNPNARKKVKSALILSYIGFDNLQIIFSLLSYFKTRT